MPVEAACPNCAGKFRLPDAAAGKKIRCPKCKGPLEVPPLESAGGSAAPTEPVPEPIAPDLSVPESRAPEPVAPLTATIVTVPKSAVPAPEALKDAWRAAPPQPPVETPRAETPKPASSVAPKTSAAIEVKRSEKKASEVKSEPRPSPKAVEPKPAATVEPKVEPKVERKTEPKVEIKVAPPKPTSPPTEQWFLRGEDGEVFGPVDQPTLDAWHDEGRMTADSQVLKEGTDQWQWASDIYPDLEEPSPTPSATLTPAASTGSSIHRDELEEPTAAVARSGVRSGRRVNRTATTQLADDADVDPVTGEKLSPHSKPVAFLLALTLGMFGIHRFYLGYVGIGLAMFFTFGGLLMWSLTDALRILFGHVPDSEGLKLRD